MGLLSTMAALEGESGGTGGGVTDVPSGGSGGGIFWEIPNFFAGVSQAFTDSIRALYDLIPNPDPFPKIIQSMNESTNLDVVGAVTFWLDTAYDIAFIQEMFAYWAEMMAIAVGIMLVWKIINLIRG